jgi:succinate dehydrogenase/fumarate reductase flavoprotein subunit
MRKGDGRRRPSRREFLRNGAAVGVGAAAIANLGGGEAAAAATQWHRVADVVVVGSGTAGMAAAIKARDGKASVIVVEENSDIGGHGILSQGSVSLGAGTSNQQKAGIKDSADLFYLENTRPDHPHTRYNDREVVRAFADHNVEVFDFIVENGVTFLPGRPMNVPAEGQITPRRQTTPVYSEDLKVTINGAAGSGLLRPLEKSARAKGVEILLQHRMTKFIREAPLSGHVLGIGATDLTKNTTINIRARQAVISCTGGSSSNLVIRTIYDPRLTEEYQVGCEPYSRQSGDTEQQGMAIGASLGATSNQRNESYLGISKANFIGARYGYSRWTPGSPWFEKAGAAGLSVADYQDAINVDMLGKRFYDETVTWSAMRKEGVHDPVFGYIAAALSSAVIEMNGVQQRAGGPIWAIFDADAVKRERWNPNPPFVDVANRYFFTADTITELAGKISTNQYQKAPMSGSSLQETVNRYNSFVDAGKDSDFNKPSPKYKIQTPPFYAAWATPILHDTYTGVRVNSKCQVLDIFGHVIPGLYAAGEAAGGFAQHGLGRALVGGYIAAKNALLESKART